MDGEVELTPEVIQAFQAFLVESSIQLKFLSGGWSAEFAQLVDTASSTILGQTSRRTLVLGAETIYSPFALQAFTEIVFAILTREQEAHSSGDAASAVVAAKRLYFGVGGSLDDFIAAVEARDATVTPLRDETDGVRRGVVRCVLD